MIGLSIPKIQHQPAAEIQVLEKHGRVSPYEAAISATGFKASILSSTKAGFIGTIYRTNMKYIFKTSKIEKSTSAIKIPKPMAMGVNRISRFGLRMATIKLLAIFVICMFRNAPMERRGPWQNFRNSFPGILTNQSVSRV